MDQTFILGEVVVYDAWDVPVAYDWVQFDPSYLQPADPSDWGEAMGGADGHARLSSELDLFLEDPRPPLPTDANSWLDLEDEAWNLPSKAPQTAGLTEGSGMVSSEGDTLPPIIVTGMPFDFDEFAYNASQEVRRTGHSDSYADEMDRYIAWQEIGMMEEMIKCELEMGVISGETISWISTNPYGVRFQTVFGEDQWLHVEFDVAVIGEHAYLV